MAVCFYEAGLVFSERGRFRKEDGGVDSGLSLEISNAASDGTKLSPCHGSLAHSRQERRSKNVLRAEDELPPTASLLTRGRRAAREDTSG